MDYRKVKSGMRVRLKNRYHDKIGTVKYVYMQDGHKFFDILFDGEDRLNVAWSVLDKDELRFDAEEFNDDFSELLKRRS